MALMQEEHKRQSSKPSMSQDSENNEAENRSPEGKANSPMRVGSPERSSKTTQISPTGCVRSPLKENNAVNTPTKAIPKEPTETDDTETGDSVKMPDAGSNTEEIQEKIKEQGLNAMSTDADSRKRVIEDCSDDKQPQAKKIQVVVQVEKPNDLADSRQNSVDERKETQKLQTSKEDASAKVPAEQVERSDDIDTIFARYSESRRQEQSAKINHESVNKSDVDDELTPKSNKSKKKSKHSKPKEPEADQVMSRLNAIQSQVDELKNADNKQTSKQVQKLQREIDGLKTSIYDLQTSVTAQLDTLHQTWISVKDAPVRDIENFLEAGEKVPEPGYWMINDEGVERIHISQNIWKPKVDYDNAVRAPTPGAFVKNMAVAIFGDELKTHTVTGSKAPRTGQTKEALPAGKLMALRDIFA